MGGDRWGRHRVRTMLLLSTCLQLALRCATTRYGVQLVQPVPRVRRCARCWYHHRDPRPPDGGPDDAYRKGPRADDPQARRGGPPAAGPASHDLEGHGRPSSWCKSVSAPSYRSFAEVASDAAPEILGRPNALPALSGQWGWMEGVMWRGVTVGHFIATGGRDATR